MATEGIEGLYVETHSYGASGAFWSSLGYRPTFETDHASGQWEHPSGGPFLFLAERPEGHALQLHPILRVADSTAFAPSREPDWVQPFTPEHWGVVEGLVRDPDGRTVSLQAPLPPGTAGPDAEAHHRERYG